MPSARWYFALCMLWKLLHASDLFQDHPLAHLFEAGHVPLQLYELE